jgi:hypothetical protein
MGNQAATVPQVDSRSGNTNVHLPVKHDLFAGTKDTGLPVTLAAWRNEGKIEGKAMKP